MELAEHFAFALDKKDEAIRLLKFNLEQYPNSEGSNELLKAIGK